MPPEGSIATEPLYDVRKCNYCEPSSAQPNAFGAARSIQPDLLNFFLGLHLGCRTSLEVDVTYSRLDRVTVASENIQAAGGSGGDVLRKKSSPTKFSKE